MGSDYFWKYSVLVNKAIFKSLLKKLIREKNSERQYELAKLIATFATRNNPGCFSSPTLENIFLDYAKTIDVDINDITYENNSFLHIFTTAYNSGGHTRVVERWIELSPPTEKHSIVIIDQGDIPYPSDFFQQITANRNGTVTVLDDNLSDIEKAIFLRKEGMKYQYIVLHIHMDDPIAILAFGTDKFKRPVIFNNHAAHWFWIGCSISDITLSEKIPRKTIVDKRLVSNIADMTIPPETKSRNISDKLDARNKLHLPNDKKILLTAGNDYKYCSYHKISIIKAIEKILNSNDNTICIALGPRNSRDWYSAKRKLKDKLHVLDFVDYNTEYFDYLSAADLYIDSWAMGGGTVVVDATSCKLPVLSLHNINQGKYIIASDACCETIDELCNKAEKILSDDKYKNEFKNNLYESYLKNNSIDSWNNNYQKMLEQTPKSHSIRCYDNFSEKYIIEEDEILVNKFSKSPISIHSVKGMIGPILKIFLWYIHFPMRHFKIWS